MTAKALLQAASDGTAIPAGFVGEKITAAGLVTVTMTNAASYYAGGAVLTLTPGVWLVKLTSVVPLNATTDNWCICALSTNNSNDGTDIVTQAYVYNKASATVSNENSAISLDVYAAASSTVLYAKGYSEDIAGATLRITAYAVRIA